MSDKTPTLTQREQRLAERVASRRENAIRSLRLATDPTIATYIRRARMTALPDGHKSKTLSDGRGGGELTSTESAADRLGYPGTEGVPLLPDDRTRHEIQMFFDALREAETAADRVVQQMNKIERLSKLREYRTGGPCACCLRDVPGTEDDRLRAGYCAACWMAYQRAGKPDNRHAFEDTRREELDGNSETAGQTA